MQSLHLQTINDARAVIELFIAVGHRPVSKLNRVILVMYQTNTPWVNASHIKDAVNLVFSNSLPLLHRPWHGGIVVSVDRELKDAKAA
jgi:hypothetical protein